jgi:hypothetical protein
MSCRKCNKRQVAAGARSVVDPYVPCDRYLELHRAELKAARAYFDAVKASRSKLTDERK